jgi:hypothetical protein
MRPWIVALAILLGTRCATVAPTVNDAQEILKIAEPRGLPWRASQLVDIDCDGTDDQVLTAQDEHWFYVGVVLGAGKHAGHHSIVAFALSGEWQESFCGPFESLTPEPLTSAMADATGEEELGYVVSPDCLGLKLVAGERDSFHLYWNRMSNALDWWRL